MGCPCPDGNGNIVDVPAKTKEMVKRMEMPQFREAIAKDKQNIKTLVKSTSSSGGGKS